jgi:cob(I)alamin adenosyltransferase
MTIYTRTGDQGETDVVGGPRVSKDAPRLEVCGAIDELNAWLGLIRCEPLPEWIAALLEQLQRQLFAVGGELATVTPASGVAVQLPPQQSSANAIQQSSLAKIGEQDVAAIERLIDRCDGKLEPLDSFILPAGSSAAAMLHIARAVCRRAERRLVSLIQSEPQAVSPNLLSYVNRLSDLLFVLARIANSEEGIAETAC